MKLTTRSALHQNLGQYLREKRVNAGLTQAEIAGKLGYSSPQFISNFERGLCSPPLKNLKALVKLYKIDANELIRLIIDEQKNVLSHALLGKRAR
jgi:transcriptional regulator with XRE-family HTH domain